MNIERITKHTEIIVADPILRKALYSAHDGKCFYTGRLVAFEDMHIDHIIPKAKGGKNCIANYVLTCGAINIRKSAKHSDKFAAMAAELNQLLYVEKVIDEYKNLLINKDVLDGMVSITSFLKAVGYGKHAKKTSFTQFALRNIASVKTGRVLSDGTVTKRPRFYFGKEELQRLFDEYPW